MSTPTLQQVLLTIPGFGAQINSFNEIVPGVPATAENLATLFAAFELRLAMDVDLTPDLMFCMHVHTAGRNRAILTEVRMRMVPGEFTRVGRAHRDSFDAHGLYQAILWAKDAALKISRDGACVCQADPLLLNFKLAKMPLCFDCMVERALQGQAA